MSINYEILPEHLRGGAQRYIEEGVMPGDFLIAVIRNNLRDAFACADATNAERMQDIVEFFYSEAPSESWGSPEHMRDWLEKFQKPVEPRPDLEK